MVHHLPANIWLRCWHKGQGILLSYKQNRSMISMWPFTYSIVNYPWYITAINKERQRKTSSITVIADFQIFLSRLSLAINEWPKMLRVRKKSIDRYQGVS